MTVTVNEVEVEEDGRPFGFSFAACFLLFFGSAVLYLANINSTSMVTMFESLYGALGIIMILVGLYCGVKALSSRGRHNPVRTPNVPAKQ